MMPMTSTQMRARTPSIPYTRSTRTCSLRKKVYDNFRAFRDTQFQWFPVAENTFDNFVYFQHAQEQRGGEQRPAAAEQRR